ncbi:helix-turn-helix domain-containing protein [Flavobacterium hibisci]|uniref:helix-turn-helix domain-containing protein n=1 Tax=Flavobacterium hibisci TaxID=1914462 RepID=UPI001CBA9965|nr:helix-turn-helix domain-containing protein [Flavobacterium hibisci]MBZ4044508.1 helix-turn-helix domain-containing protein [Flavobacterium hibisci]
MSNPFESIDQRLSNIENLLLDIKHPPQKEENRLLSVKEVAKFAGCSEISIRNYIKEGKIKAKTIGRRIFVEQSQFEKGLSEVKSLKYKR